VSGLARIVGGIAVAGALTLWIQVLGVFVVVDGWPWLWADWWRIGFSVALPVTMFFVGGWAWVLTVTFAIAAIEAVRWAWIAPDGFLGYLIGVSGPALLWPFGALLLFGLVAHTGVAIADEARYRCRRGTLKAILSPELRVRILGAREAGDGVGLTHREVDRVATELWGAGFAEPWRAEAWRLAVAYRQGEARDLAREFGRSETGIRRRWQRLKRGTGRTADPWRALLDADAAGSGLWLSPDDVARLAGDDAIQRGALEDESDGEREGERGERP